MAEDITNELLTSGVVLGAGIGLVRSLIGYRRRVQLLEQAGICARCKGTALQECQLCYGKGSIARPGYVNIADPHHRAPCKRCDGFGRHACRGCQASAAGQLVATAAQPPPLLAAPSQPARLQTAAWQQQQQQEQRQQRWRAAPWQRAQQAQLAPPGGTLPSRRAPTPVTAAGAAAPAVPVVEGGGALDVGGLGPRHGGGLPAAPARKRAKRPRQGKGADLMDGGDGDLDFQ